MKSISGDPEDFLAANGDWIWIQLLANDAKNLLTSTEVSPDMSVVEIRNRIASAILS